MTTSRTSRSSSPGPTDLSLHAVPLPTPPFSTLPAPVHHFLAGLTTPVTNAPSLDAWSSWRETLARLETLYTGRSHLGRPHPWRTATMRWLADVAVLEASSPRSVASLLQRHRLAQGLIALVDEDRQNGRSPEDTGRSVVQHLWWMAEHVDLWIQRDRGPVHTAKRMQSVATLLQRFAGGCLSVWLHPMPELSPEHLAAMGPDLVRAAELALDAARAVPGQAFAMGTGLPPAVVTGEGQRTWQRRMNPDGEALPEAFARAWRDAQQRLERLDRAVRAPLDPSLTEGRPLDEVLVQTVVDGGRQEQAARDAAQHEAEALHADQRALGLVAASKDGTPGRRPVRR